MLQQRNEQRKSSKKSVSIFFEKKYNWPSKLSLANNIRPESFDWLLSSKL